MTKPIRIGYLVGQLDNGGSERQLHYLLANMDRSKFEPSVMTLKPPGTSAWHQAIVDLNVSVTQISSQSRPKRALQIRKVFKSQDIDLVHSIHFYVTPYAWFASLGRRSTVIGSVRFYPDARGMQKHGLGWTKHLAIRGPDFWVCNSDAGSREFKKMLQGSQPIRTIKNGCEIPSDEDIFSRKINAQGELQTNDKDQVIGYIGRLDANKNVSFLLQAVFQLRSQFPNLRAIIVGDGPLRIQLEEETRSLNLNKVVKFIGDRAHAEELIPAFNVLSVTSKSEGMPNVLMEASAAQIPVVSTNVGGVAEIVLNGTTGLLFSEGDFEAYLEALTKILSNPELSRHLGKVAQRFMRDKYSVSQMVRSHENLYSSILNGVSNNAPVRAHFTDDA